jgi:hypothetical protein
MLVQPGSQNHPPFRKTQECRPIDMGFTNTNSISHLAGDFPKILSKN